MQTFHNQTNITLKNQFEQTQFIDWRTQPKNFKTYPKFFRRFDIDDYEEIKFIKNIGKITNTKKYGDVEVNLRTNPSAGGLYPCEVYIQIRAVKGLVSGIYHYEALSNSLCLIHELSFDGVEHYFSENSSKKFVFLVSNAYFRSSWKYEKRAIRYLLLDTGHQLGSIYASLKLENVENSLSFNFNKNLLNEDFGFIRSEFFQASILVDNEKTVKPRKLREKIVNVCPSDYHINEAFIEEFSQNLDCESDDFGNSFSFLDEVSKEELQKAIDSRRSIRAFKQESISKEEFEFIIKDIFDFASSFDIEIFFINFNIEDKEKGSYKNVNLFKSKDFKELAIKLAFNQNLAGTSCFTLFFTSKFDSNYVQNYIMCGFLAHIIALRASHLNISSSGIGAYFDDECQNFFQTKNNILYLQAVGR